MRRHFPDLFLGTAPRGLTTKLGSGGKRKRPTVPSPAFSLQVVADDLWASQSRAKVG